jgi:AcrR family transcriptional regulator
LSGSVVPVPRSRPPAAAEPGCGLRADAARNRDLILDSARRVFAEHGLDVAMGTIAKQAGVGAATLYRRFPRRDDLVSECMADRMAAYVAASEAALADPDPWQGFVGYLTAACAMQADDRGVTDLLTRSFPATRSLEDQRRKAHAALSEVVERAQAQGTLRADVGVDDLPLLLMANAGIVAATSVDAPEAWRRVLGITLDGLRAPGASPLATAPTQRQLLRALLRAGRRPSTAATHGSTSDRT